MAQERTLMQMLNLYGWPNRTYRSVFATLLLALAFMSGLARVQAQSTQGSILGTVHDASGAVIQGATVISTNTDDSSTHETQTDKSGLYQVLDLKPGNYKVNVSAPNFEGYQSQGLVLTARQQLRVD